MQSIQIIMIIFSIFMAHSLHEFGHVFFARLMNAQVNEISIGAGPIIYKRSTLTIRLGFFLGGYCNWGEKEFLNGFQISLIHLGGIIFNLVSASIFLLLMSSFSSKVIYPFLPFGLYSFALVVINGIPYKFALLKSDGWQVLEVIYFSIKSRLKKG
ncbi:site-2 protease family protein [Chengkuizengella marina]|uniref:Peptidase M50 domain-containing protein n=1 Tax=Chengkuizengella marina TaxID=2507566 RepID=A0A6N9Q223_9BACL|nr:site-2 protease family protein [Chengkuizengella marina]NBI27898.1 hypothetical protein [Chengkuizengella marina]